MTAVIITATGSDSRRQLARRVAWLLGAVFLVAIAISEAGRHHLGPWPILFFVVFPDLSFLAGAGVRTERGRLAPRAVPIYNFVHRPVVPLVLIAVALLDIVPALWFVAGLSWLAHIAIDRVVGYGLRAADGWQR